LKENAIQLMKSLDTFLPVAKHHFPSTVKCGC